MTRRTGLIAGLIAGIRFAVKSLEPSLMRRNAVDQGLIMGGSFLTGFLSGSLSARVLDLLPFGTAGPTVRALGVAAASSRTAQTLGSSKGAPAEPDEVDAWGEMAAEVVSAAAVAGVGSKKGSNLMDVTTSAAMLASTGVDASLALDRRSDLPDAKYLATASGVAAGLNAAVAGLAATVYLGGKFSARLMPVRSLKPVAGLVGAAGVAAAIGAGVKTLLKRVIAKIAAGNRATEVSYAEQPAIESVSGSSVTLTPFDTLGLQGRRLVSEYTPEDAIDQVMGEPARRSPVRVYVGLSTASTPEQRAELAIQELRRAGGFDRSTIIAASPAGTGYVNYIMAEAAELMARGDVAVIAVQYGEVPSMMSMGKVGEAADLYAMVVSRLREEIDDLDRPIRLLAYGESLGAITCQRGALQASPSSAELIVDGALWVGTPNGSQLFAELTGAGTPVFDHFDDVCSRRSAGLDDPNIWFLNHDNDPVTKSDPAILWRMPSWLSTAERGRNMETNQRWLPGVSFWQALIDTKNAATVIPGEFFSTGHDYRADLAEFIRAAYGFTDVSDEQMESIEARLRASEISRAERIAEGKVAVDPATA